MPKGSCCCGQYQHEYTGEPICTIVCHCKPCHKTAGANGAVETLLKKEQYKKLAGHTKDWSRKGDSGKGVTYHNCAQCGTNMSLSTESKPDMVVFNTGTLDENEAIANSKPQVEIYNKHRPAWCPTISGARQSDGVEAEEEHVETRAQSSESGYYGKGL